MSFLAYEVFLPTEVSIAKEGFKKSLQVVEPSLQLTRVSLIINSLYSTLAISPELDIAVIHFSNEASLVGLYLIIEWTP